jgi:hypothetical protein
MSRHYNGQDLYDFAVHIVAALLSHRGDRFLPAVGSPFVAVGGVR